MSVGRIIQTEACIAEGLAYLGANVAQFAVAIDLCPDVPLRRVEDGYDRLLGAIVSQQVSVAAARAIWGKLEAGGFTAQAAIQAADVETLRAHGLSKQKATYAKALAASFKPRPVLPKAWPILVLTSRSLRWRSICVPRCH